MIKNQNILVTQRALILNKDNSLLLYKRRNEDYWELPGGIVNKGESLENGLNREVLEEVGSSIKSKKLFDVGEFLYPDFEFDNHQKHNVRFVVISYMASLTSTPKVNSSEHKELKWFKKSGLVLVKIHDNSVSAISKWSG